MTLSLVVLLALAAVALVSSGSRASGWNPVAVAVVAAASFGLGLGIGSNVSGGVLAAYAAVMAALVAGVWWRLQQLPARTSRRRTQARRR